MEDQRVTQDTAKLAHEKGFNEGSAVNSWVKTLDGRVIHNSNRKDTAEDDRCKLLYLQPTQSLLQRWLREVHKILIVSLPWKDHADDNNDPYRYRPMIVGKKTYGEYNTYEESLEFGLQEALKLITIE